MSASSSLEMRMYRLFESLSHLPSVLIVVYATPLAAAVLATPILKEWPEK